MYSVLLKFNDLNFILYLSLKNIINYKIILNNFKSLFYWYTIYPWCTIKFFLFLYLNKYINKIYNPEIIKKLFI